jgi:hypothetical protein
MYARNIFTKAFFSPAPIADISQKSIGGAVMSIIFYDFCQFSATKMAFFLKKNL